MSRDIALTRPGKPICSHISHFLECIDTCVASGWWMNNIVSKVNSYYTQCDSKYEHIRRRSEAIIEQEINLSMHLGIGYILLDMPQGDKIDNFAGDLNRYLSNPCLQ